jgi:alpha-L-fucosidase
MDSPDLRSLALPADKKAWFVRDRFGMFIHWGLYALPARHEWVKNREELTDDDYQIYFDAFDPDLYDPRDWARRARLAGMRYVVLTSKHHEGFCLWDSAFTDYKVTSTRYG